MKWKVMAPSSVIAITHASALRVHAATETSSQSTPAISLLLYAVTGVVSAALTAGIMAGMACENCRRRNREPAWFIVWYTSACVLILIAAIMFGLNYFHGRAALEQNPMLLDQVVFAGIPSFGFASIVAFVVVLDRRERHLQHLSAERRKHIQRERKKARWRLFRWLHASAACLLIVISTWWCFSNLSPWVSSGASSAQPSYPLTDFATMDAKEKVRMFEKSTVTETSPAPVVLHADRLLVYTMLLGISGVWLAFTIFRWRGDLNTRLDRGLILWAKLR